MTDLYSRSQSYSTLPPRDYIVVKDISKNVQYVNTPRTPVGFLSSSKTNLDPKTLEKCTKVSVDGKSTKIGKNDSLKLEDNQLLVFDSKGNSKVLVSDFGRFQEQPAKSPKEMLYTHEKSIIKINKENTDVTEKMNILQKFFRMRTPYSTLESKGYAKNEPVFGNTLDNISAREKSAVPEFVMRITKLIELPKNIVSPGIYRASGNIAIIQKIRLKVDENRLNILDEHKDDTDVLAGALKMFFRELKNCIIGMEEYNALCDILGDKTSGENFMAVRDALQSLSRPHRETLEHLMRHLLKVISHEKDNHMSIQNMSICWGPSIIGLDTGSSKEDIIMMAQKKNSIVELLMRSYKYIFENQLRPSVSQLSLQPHYNLSRMDSLEETIPSKVKSSSMTALDNYLGEDFVEDVMRRIETHKDVSSAYKKIEGQKIAVKILSKARKKTSKTLNRLLSKARVEELCMVLKFHYDDNFVTILPREKFNNLRLLRDDLKLRGTDFPLHQVAPDMLKEIRSVMKPLNPVRKHVRLFIHFHKVMKLSGDLVTKLHDIVVFWQKTICGIECKDDNNLLLIFDIIEAFAETEWIEHDQLEQDDMSDEMPTSRSFGGSLAYISEENLCDKPNTVTKCDDVIDCCTTKRPVTFSYTKASESDQE